MEGGSANSLLKQNMVHNLWDAWVQRLNSVPQGWDSLLFPVHQQPTLGGSGPITWPLWSKKRERPRWQMTFFKLQTSCHQVRMKSSGLATSAPVLFAQLYSLSESEVLGVPLSSRLHAALLHVQQGFFPNQSQFTSLLFTCMEIRKNRDLFMQK